MGTKENGYMRRTKKEPELIPQHFKSIEEASEFWDTHDLGDYWNLTKEVNFETDIQRRVFLTAIGTTIGKETDRLCT